MRGFDDKYFETLTKQVAEVEAKTSADVVVTVEPRSGNYRDVDFAVGAGTALAGLAVALYDPARHPELWILLDVVVLFFLGAWISSAWPAVRRALTSGRRREAQVRAAAEAAFYDEHVGSTTSRTGVLVYLSLLERQLVVLADQGVTNAVAAPAWNACVVDLHRLGEAPDPPKALLDGLRELGEVLAAALPAAPGHEHELPNRPVIGGSHRRDAESAEKSG
jgi:putative membrane protein